MEGISLPEQFITATQENSFYGNQQDLARLKDDPKRLAGEFEAIFYRMLFKQFRETQLDETPFNSFSMKQIQEMQDQELSSLLGAQGHLGISRMITDYIEKTDERAFDSNKTEKQGLLKES